METEHDEWHTCIDCGGKFNIEAREQQWYLSRGWLLPKRCAACRAWRKQRQEMDARQVDR